MKYPVKFSTYCRIVTILITAVLLGTIAIQISRGGGPILIVLIALVATLFGAALFYSPQSVEISDTSLRVNRILAHKTLPFSQIRSIELCSPTMSERRDMGSGGFLGYWGHFSERSIGRYFAYYGKASDCFLVRLADGSQYLLGCQNPAGVVDSVNRHLRDK